MKAYLQKTVRIDTDERFSVLGYYKLENGEWLVDTVAVGRNFRMPETIVMPKYGKDISALLEYDYDIRDIFCKL